MAMLATLVLSYRHPCALSRLNTNAECFVAKQHHRHNPGGQEEVTAKVQQMRTVADMLISLEQWVPAVLLHIS